MLFLDCLPTEVLRHLLIILITHDQSFGTFATLLRTHESLERLVLLVTDHPNHPFELLKCENVETVALGDLYKRDGDDLNKLIIFSFQKLDEAYGGPLLNPSTNCLYGRYLNNRTPVMLGTHHQRSLGSTCMQRVATYAKVPVIRIVHVPRASGLIDIDGQRDEIPTDEALNTNFSIRLRADLPQLWRLRRGFDRPFFFSVLSPIIDYTVRDYKSTMFFDPQPTASYKLLQETADDCFGQLPTHPLIAAGFQPPVVSIEFNTMKEPNIELLYFSEATISSSPLNESSFSILNANWKPLNPYGRTCVHASQLGQDQAHWSVDQRHFPLTFTRQVETIVLHGISDKTVERCDFQSTKFLYWKRLAPRKGSNALLVTRTFATPKLKTLKIFALLDDPADNSNPMLSFNAPELEQLILVGLVKSETIWNISDLLCGHISLHLKELYLYQPKGSVRLEIRMGDIEPVSRFVRKLAVVGYTPRFLDEKTDTVFHKLEKLTIDPTTLQPDGTRIQMIVRSESFPYLESLELLSCSNSNALSSVSTIEIRVHPFVSFILLDQMLSSGALRVNGIRLTLESGRKPISPRSLNVWRRRRDGLFLFLQSDNLRDTFEECLDCAWK